MKNRLKEARFFKNKPQIQLWLETGIHYSTISRIECAYLRPTRVQKEKLAQALNCNPDWLVPPENEKSSSLSLKVYRPGVASSGESNERKSRV